MGSRLHLPNVGEDWDPDSMLAMLHWVRISAERERQEIHWSAPATVMTAADGLTDVETKHGFGGVAADFYREFLRYLVDLKFCATTPVWAVGYDWRQGNRDSGNALDRQIENILGAESATNFILITHSMGGIVSRASLKIDGFSHASKCLGVIHVVQPVRGAAVFYRRMYTGALSALDGGWAIAHIQGTSAHDFATILSALRGPCELIPNDDYRDIGGAEWLMDARPTPPAAFPHPVWSSYLSADAPPGVWWSVAGEKSGSPLLGTPESELKKRIAEAQTFHDWLGSFKHEKTWAVYSTGRVSSTGMDTDMGVQFGNDKKDRGAQMVRRSTGDGTVPDTSGSALFSVAETSDDVTGAIFTVNPAMRQSKVTGVDHADAFNNSVVLAVVTQMLTAALGGTTSPTRDAAPPSGGSGSPDGGAPLPAGGTE